MRFLDEVKIFVQSGDGGNGIAAFRREKYVPRGGPSGGDGGRGGDVIFVAEDHLNTLIAFRYRQHYKAQRGKNGQSKECTGRSAPPLIIKVPVGTVARNDADGSILFDFIKLGDQCVLARGGDGGMGNVHFKSATNRAPTDCTPGWPGQSFWLRLELKMLADVGLIGMPNAGKSTLISRISAARPEIADYPFTTLTPELGVVRNGLEDGYVVADIPGLIPGASSGKGLGISFLKHVERCALLLHLVECAPMDETKPLKNYRAIEQELALYSPHLAEKPRWIALSKSDLLTDEKARKKVLKKFGKAYPELTDRIFFISSATGEGIETLSNMMGATVYAARALAGEESRRALQDAPTKAGQGAKPEPEEELLDDLDGGDEDDDAECHWVR